MFILNVEWKIMDKDKEKGNQIKSSIQIFHHKMMLFKVLFLILIVTLFSLFVIYFHKNYIIQISGMNKKNSPKYMSSHCIL